MRVRESWAVAGVVAWASSVAAAPCQLTAGPAQALAWPAALAHFHPRRADASDPRAPLVFVDDDEQARVVEPPALGSFALGGGARQLRTTARHVIALADRGLLVAGARGGQLAPAHDLTLRAFDAVDGADGRSWIAGAQEGRVIVGHLDGKAHFVLDTVLPATRALTQVGLVRARSGFVVAWIGWSERGPSTLFAAWLDRRGVAPGPPLALDVADEEQLMANVALAADGDAVVVAWNPIVGRAEHERVPVELRAFRLTRERPPTIVRKLPLQSIAWVVAGSAGGVLANDLQAVTAHGQALLAWLDFATPGDASAHASDLQPVVRAALADGGEPLAIDNRRGATALLRAQRGGATLTLLDDAPRAQTIALTSAAEGCPATAVAPWLAPATPTPTSTTPPTPTSSTPPTPTSSTLTSSTTPTPTTPTPTLSTSDAPVAGAAAAGPPSRAECERLVARVLTLAAADPKGKAQVAELRARRQVFVDRCRAEMSRQVYDCLQQAPNFAAADHCQ